MIKKCSVMVSKIFTFLLLLAVTSITEAQSCLSIYKRFNAQHTFCLPTNNKCEIVRRGVTKKDKEVILRIHNEYRSRISNGQETRAGGMPPAANMLQMEWDNELSRIAQKHAERCIFENDCYTCRMVQAFPVGQNIGLVTDIQTTTESPDWKKFIKKWYEEIIFFNKDNVNPFISQKEYANFTQVIWASSWKVGCGWALYKSGETYTGYTVCNYGPAGNGFNGESELYKVGKPCSACPKNTCCGASCKASPRFPGLCKVVLPFLRPEGPGPRSGNFLLFCDFFNQADCAVKFDGKPWILIRTAGGNWMSTNLKEGQRTILILTKKFITNGKFCAKVFIRSGPILDGQLKTIIGNSSFQASHQKITFQEKIERIPHEKRQNFMPLFYEVNFRRKSEVQFSFSFEVPQPSPPQFVEIKEVSIKEGACD